MWFLVSPIPDHTLDQVRASGRDVSGIPMVRLPATGGEPLRCCLRNAAPDERLLFGYEPPLPPSPYREIGPVFAHADPCPPDWYGREQILCAYDRRGWIHPATRRHDGTDPIGLVGSNLRVRRRRAQPRGVRINRLASTSSGPSAA